MIGVDRKIAALIADCDHALAAFPRDGDQRWLARLQDQRSRLLHPDLRTSAALATTIAEDAPALAGLVAAAMKDLTAAHPELRPFHARLVQASAAALAA